VGRVCPAVLSCRTSSCSEYILPSPFLLVQATRLQALGNGAFRTYNCAKLWDVWESEELTTGWENDDKNGESQHEDTMMTSKAPRLHGPAAPCFLFIAFMALGLILGRGIDFWWGACGLSDELLPIIRFSLTRMATARESIDSECGLLYCQFHMAY
jgi:hypothetical protein